MNVPRITCVECGKATDSIASPLCTPCAHGFVVAHAFNSERSSALLQGLVRRLDEALNGVAGAAEKPRLVDILSQVENLVRKNGRPVLVASTAPENETLRAVAEHIAASATPSQEERLEVAYAIARYLKLDWPSAYEPRGVTDAMVEAALLSDATAHERYNGSVIPGEEVLMREALEAADKARPREATSPLPATDVRPLSEWHEDCGYCVWWCWRDGDWLGEPAHIGSPLDSDWPGYHTHWSPHPAFPARLAGEDA